MEIKILHIDDEVETLQLVADQLNGSERLGHTLKVVDSCNFETGLINLATKDYDLVILDLCVGNASVDSQKIGVDILTQIKQRAFIPVIFFTGLPDYVEHQKSDVVKVASKGEGFDQLESLIDELLETGIMNLKYDINKIMKEELRSYFWDFVDTNHELLNKLKQDDVSLKYVLLRRLGKRLSSESIKKLVNEPQFKASNSHPMEFYIYPHLPGEYETGDLIKAKSDGIVYLILTPSCDMVDRGDGKRKAERILLIKAVPFSQTEEYQKLLALQTKQKGLQEQQKDLSEEEKRQVVNLTGSLKKRMKPATDRYFFLPKTFFIEASLLDLQDKKTVSYQELESDYDCLASVDDPVVQSIVATFARYYTRIGYNDLDIDYAFSKM